MPNEVDSRLTIGKSSLQLIEYWNRMYLLSFTSAIGVQVVFLFHLFPSVANSFAFLQNSRTLTRGIATTTCRVPSHRKAPPKSRFSSCVLFESSEEDYVEAEDLPAIQTLFSKHCDKDGLMTKSTLQNTPPFDEMLVSLLLSSLISWTRRSMKNWIYSSRITPRQCRMNIWRGRHHQWYIIYLEWTCC